MSGVIDAKTIDDDYDDDNGNDNGALNRPIEQV
jgi:hypothetical protein